MRNPLKAGSVVTWSSQAAGSYKTKTGTIIEVVPAGKEPLHHEACSVRREVSYVVRVDEPLKRGGTRSRTYWPLVTALRTVGK